MVFTLRTLCSMLLFTGPDALHHGWYGPECLDGFLLVVHTPLCAMTYAHGFRLQENCAGSAVAVRLNVVVDFSVVAQRQFPLVLTVQNTTEILLLQYIDKVVDVGCAGSANS